MTNAARWAALAAVAMFGAGARAPSISSAFTAVGVRGLRERHRVRPGRCRSGRRRRDSRLRSALTVSGANAMCVSAGPVDLVDRVAVDRVADVVPEDPLTGERQSNFADTVRSLSG